MVIEVVAEAKTKFRFRTFVEAAIQIDTSLIVKIILISATIDAVTYCYARFYICLLYTSDAADDSTEV